jgi:hypothetical protein
VRPRVEDDGVGRRQHPVDEQLLPSQRTERRNASEGVTGVGCIRPLQPCRLSSHAGADGSLSLCARSAYLASATAHLAAATASAPVRGHTSLENAAAARHVLRFSCSQPRTNRSARERMGLILRNAAPPGPSAGRCRITIFFFSGGFDGSSWRESEEHDYRNHSRDR